MKQLRKISFLFLLLMIFALLLSSCGASDKGGAPMGGADYAYEGVPSGETDGEFDFEKAEEAAVAKMMDEYFYDKSVLCVGDEYIVVEKSSAAKIAAERGGEVLTPEELEEWVRDNVVYRPAGLITAGAQDDNDRYLDWLALFAQGEGQGKEAENGKFYQYPTSDWHFRTLRRVTVTVTKDVTDETGTHAEPVSGATVVAYAEGGRVLAKAVSNACGVAYLFPDEEAGTLTVDAGEGGIADAAFTSDNRDITVSVSSSQAKQNVIELMFVIDVTGSMGDELFYLQNEIDDVIGRLNANDPETVIRLALLFYRDDGDKEKFAYHDFLDVTQGSNLQTMKTILSRQTATGGGDYEEAVDEALKMAMSKQWSTGAVTKIIFHVLDAPAHDKEIVRTRYFDAVTSAAAQGIRICPVLASGADTMTEYLTRQEAVMTGGTFVFITDDSGIGGSHHDPDLPNVTIEALNDLMIRLIIGYHTGTFADPVDWRQSQTTPIPTPIVSDLPAAPEVTEK